MTTSESIFLLLGPERGEKDFFIHNSIAKLETALKAKADVYKYFAFDTPVLEVISLLQNGLLFSDCKAVIVFGVENYKKNDIQLIADYIAHPALNALLFLCSDETRLSGSKLETIVGSRQKKIFWELLEHQKKGFVRNFFNKRSITVSDEAVDFIIEAVESSTRDLKSVCERMEIFFGSNAEIKLEEIENYIYHSREENVFTLFAGMIKKDFGLSLEILDKLLLSNDDDPIRIMSGILWQVQQSVQYASLLAENHSPEEAFEKLGVRTKRQQKMLAVVRQTFSLPLLQRIIMLIADYDTKLRIYQQKTHRFLLEFFIYSVIGLSR